MSQKISCDTNLFTINKTTTMKICLILKRLIVLASLLIISDTLLAQTDQDAIMMGKHNFCTGLMYGHSSWTNYWEGAFKRDNLNLGTVSSNSFAIMGNYGITNKLNFLFGIPYIQTKASAGTLHQQKGVQDLSVWLKWMPVEKVFGKNDFSLYLLGGASTPITNYVADFLPLSIGLRSTTLSARLMLDYQRGVFFATGSATYAYRNDITIDRTSYYTTGQVTSNKVDMPDVASFSLRTGYRSQRLVAEAVVTAMQTLGGFDIRKNDMPFPSNKMNATTLGVNGKYEITQIDGLALTGGTNYVVAGRNVGQAASYNLGVFYVIEFHPRKKHNDEKKSSTTSK
jgi:hypothetical protein